MALTWQDLVAVLVHPPKLAPNPDDGEDGDATCEDPIKKEGVATGGSNAEGKQVTDVIQQLLELSEQATTPGDEKQQDSQQVRVRRLHSSYHLVSFLSILTQ